MLPHVQTKNVVEFTCVASESSKYYRFSYFNNMATACLAKVSICFSPASYRLYHGQWGAPRKRLHQYCVVETPLIIYVTRCRALLLSHSVTPCASCGAVYTKYTTTLPVDSRVAARFLYYPPRRYLQTQKTVIRHTALVACTTGILLGCYRG